MATKWKNAIAEETAKPSEGENESGNKNGFFSKESKRLKLPEYVHVLIQHAISNCNIIFVCTYCIALTDPG